MTRTPLSRALIAAVMSARRETSTTVTERAPLCAAATPIAPLPVPSSRTSASRGGCTRRMTSASSHVSLRGVKTPGRVMIRMVAGYASRAPPANVTLEPTIDISGPALDAPSLRAVFDAPRPPTIGIEEELMLLDPGTLDLAPRCEQALAALAGDTRFKPELVAAQIETVTPPRRTVGDAAQVLRGARRDLLAALGGRALAAGAGVHPFAAALGELHGAARYNELAAEFASIARRQLVFGLHVHVAIGGAERAVAVHDALRSYLPDLAGARGQRAVPRGPRQRAGLGAPDDRGDAAAPGRAAGAGQLGGLRARPELGRGRRRAAGEAALVVGAAAASDVRHDRGPRRRHADDRRRDRRLRRGRARARAWLAERVAAGEELPVAPTWRIAENRWWAARHGLDASLADLVTGEREPLRVRLERLFDELAPVAVRLGCAAQLERARAMAAGPGGAARQRAVAARGGT